MQLPRGTPARNPRRLWTDPPRATPAWSPRRRNVTPARNPKQRPLGLLGDHVRSLRRRMQLPTGIRGDGCNSRPEFSATDATPDRNPRQRKQLPIGVLGDLDLLGILGNGSRILGNPEPTSANVDDPSTNSLSFFSTTCDGGIGHPNRRITCLESAATVE